MRERLLIFFGCGLFVVLFTYPLWRALAAGVRPTGPQLQQARGGQCIAPADQMRASHMKMLMQWREDVVRRGDRRFVAFNGKVYDKSLTRTCLGCHNKEQSCDRCHAYSGVSGPYCWNCHNDPHTAAAKVMP